MGWFGWRRGSVLFAAGLMGLADAGAQRFRVGDAAVYAGVYATTAHGAPGYLGVDLREVPEGMVPKVPRGAEILRIDHDGPAGKAGLLEHDIVVSMNGQTIDGAEPLRRMLRDTPPGRGLTLTISRGGQQQTVSLQMANREDVDREAWAQHIVIPDSPTAPAEERADRRGNGFFSGPGRLSRNLLGGIVLSPAYTGAMLEMMVPQLAEFFGAQGKNALLVRSVDANSPAAAAGMHAGDVVVRVNSVSIMSSGDWGRVMRDNKGRAIPVVVLRERREQTLTMIPNAKHHSSLLPDFWKRSGSGFWSSPAPDRASSTGGEPGR